MKRVNLKCSKCGATEFHIRRWKNKFGLKCLPFKGPGCWRTFELVDDEQFSTLEN